MADDDIQAYALKGGKQLWTLPVSAPIPYAHTVVDGVLVSIVPNKTEPAEATQEIVTVDLRAGRIARRQKGHVYRGDSGVVLVTLDGTTRGLNPRTGTALWSMPDPTAGTSESLDDQLYRSRPASVSDHLHTLGRQERTGPQLPSAHRDPIRTNVANASTAAPQRHGHTRFRHLGRSSKALG
ncbi:hypothetical protein [Streptomyces sp. SPB4]|uniref:hypothetical protein n=1 Tax=Streptomyces sp. SPB4 TaxID=2940553 RepID=UPI0024758E14|nr:hypothetical protein [Streptomyces sp. SPB4]